MNKVLTTIFFTFSISIYSQNISYIQQDSVFSSIPNYKIYNDAIEKTGKQYQEEIKKASDDLSSKVNNLLKSYNVKENEDLNTIKSRMSKIDTTSLGIMIEEEKIITKKAKNYESNLNLQYQKDIQPILDKINITLKNYAKKNKIDLIYIIEKIRPTLGYIDENKNITKQIIALLK